MPVDNGRERVIPEEWDKSSLPSTGHALRFKVQEGLFANNFSAEQLNPVSRYALARSSLLFDLAEKGKDITLSPDEIDTLAASFEEISFQLGDGSLFDPEQPKQPSRRLSAVGFVRRALKRVVPGTS
jgi:hypothetical protein